MNSLILFFVCAFSAFVSCVPPPDVMAKVLEVKSNCIKESGVKEEAVANTEAGIFSDDVELKKFFVCIGKFGGMLDDEGHLHADKLKEKLSWYGYDEAKINEVISKCSAEMASIEETAIVGAKCAYPILHS